MKLRAALALTALIFIPSLVYAHAELTYPAPRGACDSAACKTSPCGQRVAGAVTAELIVGSSATIQWTETIEHPGWYELRLSTNGQPNGFFPWVLNSNLTDMTGPAPHAYGQQFTVPTTANCNPCILQLVQVMTENPSAPSYYYNCADIRIAAVASSPTPTPNQTATPTPTPGNPSDTVSGSALCSIAGFPSGPRVGFAFIGILVLGAAIVFVRRGD